MFFNSNILPTMGLPKGYKKTWNSGGGRPALPEQERKKSVNIYLTPAEKACLDTLRGNMSISNFIKRKLRLDSTNSDSTEATQDV